MNKLGSSNMNTKFKVAFVDFSNNFFDRHAIYCLSAYLKNNGIETCYVNSRSFSKTMSSISEVKPDILLYSAYSRDIPLFINFDKFVKRNLKIRSIIGGVGPTFEWRNIAGSSIDALCVGEGEQALLDYIRNGLSPSKNIIANNNSAPSEYFPFLELDNMPFPERDLVYKDDYVLKNMPNKQFLAGRGCPYMCTYCHNILQNKMFRKCGPLVRKKSVQYLIDEVKDVKRRYPLEIVSFQDDTFILKKEWVFEFCERFPREIGLPYTCNIRADLIDDEIVKALKQSNCVCAYWSIESGNDFFRNEVLKRKMSKEQILEASHLLNKHKVPHRSGGMVGLPGEKIEEMLETLDLNIKIKPQFGFASIFIPYPGLELTDYALKHGYLSEELLSKLPKNTHLSSVLNFTANENLWIKKITYLYPLIVDYPILFYNRRIYNALLKLPKILLHVFFNLYCAYKLSRLYKVKTALPLKIMIILRYLKNPF